MNPRWNRSGAEWKLDPHRTTVVMLWADGVEALCVTFPVSGSARSVNSAETSVWDSQLMRRTPYRARP